ncbi:MAG: YihY/virulence factor BrkB family protein [Candidatus Dormibacteraeota bacterium]|nr:YihY/virulence factor BrkB family protein [Candidatus Dormibacteraeota bacterium]MDQ6921411.1 YihY/virulence factor BrkB family protein [Candidatus Dormibacteraeota bacterium]
MSQREWLRSIVSTPHPRLQISLPSRLRPLRRWLKHWPPMRVLLVYRDTKAGDYAAGLAFHALLTMFPIFLGLLTLLGLITRNEDLDLRVASAIVTSFPLGMQIEVRNAILSLQHSAGTYGLVAVAWLAWTGTGYFSHLEWAVNRIYISPNRSFLHQRLMGLGMICALSTSIAAGVGAAWVLSEVKVLSPLGFVINWLILALLLWSMYHVVPNRRVGLHESWPGALLASFLIQVLNLAFPLYLRLTHNFNAFGRGLLLFLVLVTWLYLVSQLLLLGAVLNRLQLGRIPTIGRSHEHEDDSPWE